MEFILIAAIPALFLLLAIVMMVVSETSGYVTYMRMSARQRAANRVIAAFLRRMRLAQGQLARRSAELARLSGRLQASNRELESLNALKSRFLSVAAHDMRTPLASIRGFAEGLAQRASLPKDRRDVSNIMTAAEQMSRLTADLTDLAIIEAGKLTMEPALFDYAALARELWGQWALLAARKGVELRADLPASAPLTGDRFRLGQVLANLVGNAIKFTPAGGLVELRVREAAGGWMTVVSDTGPGIAREEQRLIFEKFYQGRGAAGAPRQGWGLGLSIAHEILRAHGGEIGVESAGPGRGSRFWFFVPARPGARVPGPSVRRALAAAALLLALVPAAPRAQTLPLEDKARYDRYLEQKAESVLVDMLGPGRVKVVVDATVDFTRTEKFQITGGKSQQKGQEGETLYAWRAVTGQGAGPADAGPSELLPGIPLGDHAPQSAPESYERESGFLPSFVKKLAVTILLDRGVPADQASNIQTIVVDLLQVDPERGDSLTMVRTTFPPPWKTMWYAPDQVSMLFRYSLLGFLSLVTLLVLTFCFIRLAGAMDSMARSQSNYGFDLGGDAAAAAPPATAEPEAKAEEAPEKEAEDERPVIRVEEQQLPVLATMLQGEDAENVALVVAHLEPERRRAFLRLIPRELEARVLASLARVRFVERPIVEAVKEEIERRLGSAVGGLHNVCEIVDEVDPGGKRELLELLERTDPALASTVRARVLLIEDLLKMSAPGWQLLTQRVRLEDWASALKQAPPELKQALRGHMLPRTWSILEQVGMAAPATPEQVEAAQGKVLEEVARMISSGLIEDFRLAPAAAPAAPAAA